MRYFALILLIALTSCKKETIIKQEMFVKAKIIPSKIDSLITDTEIKEYITDIDSNYINFKIVPIQEIGLGEDDTEDRIKALATKKGINKTFYKEDFDNNGYTDLLIMGGWPVTSTAFTGTRYNPHWIVVMNNGSVRHKIIEAQLSYYVTSIPEITSINNEPVINVYYYVPKDPLIKNFPFEIQIENDGTIKNKLVYRHNGFTEYNANPKDNHIEKIEFESGPCFGQCPIYRLIINKDRSATLLAEMYNINNNDTKEIKGTFKGNIDSITYKNLTYSLNYIDFKNLKDHYSVSHTCARTGYLKITYDNGKTKFISDYGMIGTSGLKSLYSYMSELRFNQKWQKISDTTAILETRIEP